MAANLNFSSQQKHKILIKIYAAAAAPERYNNVAIELCQFHSKAQQKYL